MKLSSDRLKDLQKYENELNFKNINLILYYLLNLNKNK